MPAMNYDSRYPGDQAFLPASGTSTKAAKKKKADEVFITSTFSTAGKYDPRHPGDQQFDE